MTQPHNLFFELQRLVADLALVDRNHYLLGTNRRENDIEHSFTVAILCWFTISHHKLNLDIGTVLKYALVHDFVERYAGDTNTFAHADERASKLVREKAALEQLSVEFADFDDMTNAMHAYETKGDAEALFVWTVDKMQALILGDMDNWRPYQELGIDYEAFSDKYRELLSHASPHCKEIFETIVAYCKSTYYSRPKA